MLRLEITYIKHLAWYLAHCRFPIKAVTTVDSWPLGKQLNLSDLLHQEKILPWQTHGKLGQGIYRVLKSERGNFKVGLAGLELVRAESSLWHNSFSLMVIVRREAGSKSWWGTCFDELADWLANRLNLQVLYFLEQASKLFLVLVLFSIELGNYVHSVPVLYTQRQGITIVLVTTSLIVS